MGKPAPLGVGASGIPSSGDQANAVVTGSFSAVGPSQPFEFFGPWNLSIYASINTALTTTAGSLNFTVASGTGLAAGDAVNSVNVPPGATIATIAGTAGTLALPPIAQFGKTNTSNAIISGLAVTNGLLGAGVSGSGIPSGATVLSIVTPAVAGNNVVPTQFGSVQISLQPTQATTPSQNETSGTALVFTPTANGITVTGTDNNAVFTGAAINYTGTVQLERSFDGGSTYVVVSESIAGTPAIYTAGTPVSCIVDEPEDGVLWRVNCTAYTSGTINYRLSTTGAAATSLGKGSPI